MEKRQENRQEDQVWQRVLARQEAAMGESLRGLLEITRTMTGVYRQIGGGLAGEPARLARVLAGEEAENAACLRGLWILAGLPEDRIKNTAALPMQGRRQLMWCYHQARALVAEYTARSAEGELGIVFQELARRESRQCFRIAQLLGMTEGAAGHSSSIR